MTLIKATGHYQHDFTGSNLSGAIGLSFATEEEARDAHSVLGVEWKISPRAPKILVIGCTHENMPEIKAKLKGIGLTISPCGWRHCHGQCKDAEIDNLAHSIDYGATFTVEIPRPVPLEQTTLFG